MPSRVLVTSSELVLTVKSTSGLAAVSFSLLVPPVASIEAVTPAVLRPRAGKLSLVRTSFSVSVSAMATV